MTVNEVAKLFGITADTLRYYEKEGVIPEVARTRGEIRNYTEEDLNWIQTAICFKSAGLSVEMLAQYVRLFQKGDTTLKQRCDLLKKARVEVLEKKKKYDDALEKLEYKIAKYEEAVKTGKLVWDSENTELCKVKTRRKSK